MTADLNWYKEDLAYKAPEAVGSVALGHIAGLLSDIQQKDETIAAREDYIELLHARRDELEFALKNLVANAQRFQGSDPSIDASLHRAEAVLVDVLDGSLVDWRSINREQAEGLPNDLRDEEGQPWVNFGECGHYGEFGVYGAMPSRTEWTTCNLPKGHEGWHKRVPGGESGAEGAPSNERGSSDAAPPSPGLHSQVARVDLGDSVLAIKNLESFVDGIRNVASGEQDYLQMVALNGQLVRFVKVTTVVTCSDGADL